MNDENLIPCTMRSKNEAREMSRRGGIKSGEVRRQKRDARELALAIIREGDVEIDRATKMNLKKLGVNTSEVGKSAEAIAMAALSQKMMRGDVNAMRLWLEIIGEDARSKLKREEMAFEREIMGTQEEEEEQSDGFMEAMTDVIGEVFDNGTDVPQNVND